MSIPRHGYISRDILSFVVLTLLGVTLFANSINGEFLWDDKSFIVDSPYVKDLNNLLLVFQPWKFNQLPGGFVDITRPLMFLSLLVDYQLWGLDPKGYHITNIVIHLLSSFLVYLFSLNLKMRRSLAFIASLVFLVHPVHTEAVAGMTFREDLLVTAFYVASFICFMRAVNNPEGKLNIRSFLFSIVLYVFSMLSKEMAVTFPAIALVYLLLMCRRLVNYKKMFLLILPFVVVTIPYLVWIGGTYGALTVPPSRGEGGLFQSLFNIPSLLLYYVKIFLFPINLSADPGYVLKSSFFSVDVLYPFFPLLLLMYLVVKSLTKEPLPALLSCYFFLTLSPVLQILPSFNLVAERFLYLPSVALSIAFALLADNLFNRKRVLLLIAAILCSFSLITVERNYMWKDALTLWTDAAKKNRNSFFARINIANYYFEKKNYKMAEKDFLDIIDRWPDKPEAYNNLAIIYMENNLYSEAEKTLKEAVLQKAATAETHMNMAVSLSQLKRYSEAIAEAKVALKEGPWLTGGRPFLARTYVDLGKTRLEKGDFRGALDSFGQAIAYGYGKLDIHVYLARSYYGLEKYEKTIEEYERVLSISRNYGPAYFFIAESLRQLGRYSEALSYYREFLSKWSHDSRYSGLVRERIGSLEEK